jgi:hypothetical protein
MKSLATAALLLGTSLLAFAETPKGLSDTDWSSIRAAYDAGRHAFHPQADGTLTAANPGLGWTMTFDDKGFTATSANNTWTWGLELISSSSYSSSSSSSSSSSNRLELTRPNGLTEWFINDTRGLEQGWTLTQSVGPLHLRVRGSLPASVSAQSISFGGQITYSGLKAWDANGQPIPTHFEPTAEGFAVHYDDTGAQYPITIDPLAQNAYLKASNTGAGDGFGIAVAVSGDTVVVGALFEASSSSGINSTPNDAAPEAGAAYVFVRAGASWSQQAYLKASNAAAGDQFGNAVAVSGDTIVVGALFEASSTSGINSTPNDAATRAGAAYVFVRSGTSWSQQAYLKARNAGAGDFFGNAVAVSGDTVVVGAPNEASSSTGINSTPNESASLAGAAYVFVRSGTSWFQQAYLKARNTGAGDYFGIAVTVSGSTIVVGAPGEASSTGLNPANNDAPGAGAAYVFVRAGASWFQQAYLKAGNAGQSDQFGHAVAASGDTVVVGANWEASSSTGINSTPNNDALAAGAAYVFVRSGTSWSQQAYLKANNAAAGDYFGTSVAVSGDTVVIGAYWEDSSSSGIHSIPNESASFAGAAYVFARSGASWSQQAYLKAGNAAADDRFGTSVAVSGDTVVVGAYLEDSSTTGVNSIPNDNASDAGAVYLFGLGELLTSLSRSAAAAPGAPDLAFGNPGFAALSPAGETLFESGLLGSGASAGRNKALFSTVGGPLYLALQSGSVVSGLAGLPFGAKIAALSQPLHNRSAPTALFQATVSGPGLNAANNRLLCLDNGHYISPLLRTGVALPELDDAVPSAFKDLLQRDGAEDLLALGYTLRRGVAGVTAGNDSGLLLLDHSGQILDTSLRAGQSALGGVGTFGAFGRAAIYPSEWVSFLAKFIPASGRPVDALFYTGLAEGRNPPLQGQPAGGTTGGERYGVFTGLADNGQRDLLRATLTNSPAASNEGVWTDQEDLVLRKGQDLGDGLKLARIVRVWGSDLGQAVAQVRLSGPGVNGANNQALLLRQLDGNLLILLRTGQPAPGLGLNKVTVASLQAIDVDADQGHYTILGSLKGAPAAANQALWSGQITLGDDTTGQHLRLPRLLLQKGDLYHTESTPGDRIRSIALKPAPDPSGVGARGLAQVINRTGQIVLTLTGDRKVQELVRLTP